MSNAFNTPNARMARSGDIPVWDAKLNQWVPQSWNKQVIYKNLPRVYINGSVLASAPIIQTQSSTITSTGVFSTYAITFPFAFTSVPVVTAWSSLSSGSNFTTISLIAVTTSFFQFALQAFNPGQVAVPTGQTVVVSWIAMGV